MKQKKKNGVRKLVQAAWDSGSIYCEVPPTGNASNEVSRWKRLTGNQVHRVMEGKYLGVYFNKRIKEQQKEIEQTK